jgi:hypothetical protein
MTSPDFDTWLSTAFPWLPPNSPDATRLRAAYDAGRAGQTWVSTHPAWSRDARNEHAAWQDGYNAAQEQEP